MGALIQAVSVVTAAEGVDVKDLSKKVEKKMEAVTQSSLGEYWLERKLDDILRDVNTIERDRWQNATSDALEKIETALRGKGSNPGCTWANGAGHFLEEQRRFCEKPENQTDGNLWLYVHSIKYAALYLKDKIKPDFMERPVKAMGVYFSRATRNILHSDNYDKIKNRIAGLEEDVARVKKLNKIIDKPSTTRWQNT